MGYIMKYLVRPIQEDHVCDSIFETPSLSEALKKINECNTFEGTRYIIVNCENDQGSKIFKK